MRISVAGLALAPMLCLFALPSSGHAEEDEGIKLSGDFRGRYEGFRFDTDDTGSKKETRNRIRYRFRVNLKAGINDHFKAAARLTTGDTDNRSGNQTLGSPADFEPAEFDLRRAYVTYMPFAGGDLGGGRKGSWSFDFGRTPNPFIWGNSPDKMVWDSDIALAGAGTMFDVVASDAVKIFANTGYYVIAENSSAKDPYLFPFQAGLEVKPNDQVSFGARGSYYYYNELDADFITRATVNGNIEDGLTGDANGGDLGIVEGQGFVKFAGSDDWPVTAFGGASVNTSAKESPSAPEAGKADKAYNVGLDVGNKKKAVRLGVAWVNIEANALVSQFIDSDYLDGVTNRKGVIGYAQRQLLANTELGGTLFWSDGIETSLLDSIEGSKRWRWQLDLIVKF